MENENPLANLSLNGHQKKLAKQILAHANSLEKSHGSLNHSRKAAFYLSEYLCTRLDELGPARDNMERALASKLPKVPRAKDSNVHLWICRALERMKAQNLPSQWFESSESLGANIGDAQFEMRLLAKAARAGVCRVPPHCIVSYSGNLGHENPALAMAAKELMLAASDQSVEYISYYIDSTILAWEKLNPDNPAAKLRGFASALAALGAESAKAKSLLERCNRKISELEAPKLEREKISMFESTRRSIDQRLVRFTHRHYKPPQAMQK